MISLPNPLPIMTDSDLYTLKENYCNLIIDGMDMDSLCQMAHDLLMDAYKDCTENELTEEILDLYDQETYDSLVNAQGV